MRISGSSRATAVWTTPAGTAVKMALVFSMLNRG
jgi:hypothetical protein